MIDFLYRVPLHRGFSAPRNSNMGGIFYVCNCTFMYDDESNPVGVIAGDV